MNGMVVLRALMGFAGALIVAATLPLVLELSLVTLAHLLPRRRRADSEFASSSNSASDIEALPTMAIAVIVPAHNEEQLIARTVLSLREAATAGTRILVIAHNCIDKTADRARDAGAEVLVYNDAKASGKGYALRYGFEQALLLQADAVLVVDADSTVSPNLIGAVEQELTAGAEVVQCKYSMTSATSRPNARLAALAFRGFNVVRPEGRKRLGLSCGIVGNGFAIRSSVLRTIPYDALSVVEDLEYHIHLVMAGKRVEYLEEALITSELPISKEGESTQRARWEGGRLLAARRWCGPLLGQVLRGRLRLIEPLLEVSCLPLAYGVFLLVLGVCIPLGWLRLYALVGLAVVALHVLMTAWLSPERWGALRLLTMAPIYVLWKLRIIPGVLRGSNSRAAWVRTKRDAEATELEATDPGTTDPGTTDLQATETAEERVTTVP